MTSKMMTASVWIAAAVMLLMVSTVAASFVSSAGDSERVHPGDNGVHWSLLRTHPEYVRMPMQRGKGSLLLTEMATQMESDAPHPAPRPSRSHFHKAARRVEESKRGFHSMSSTTGGAPMTGCGALDFTIPITFGASATVFDVLFDTGSSTLAIAGATCSSCTNAGVSKLYGNTGTNTGQPASGSYGDGSGWTATIYTDTVTIHDATGTITPAVSMGFASMETQTGNFFSVSSCTTVSPTNSPTEGIIGFGYQGLAEAGTDSWFYKYHLANSALANSFYVEMCLLDGAVWMSGMSLATYKDQFYYVPIKAETYYVVGVTNVLINGVSRALGGAGEWIVDSGSTLFTVPNTVYPTLVSALNVNLGNYFNLGGEDVSRSSAAGKMDL
jgi:hypothetical protein